MTRGVLGPGSVSNCLFLLLTSHFSFLLSHSPLPHPTHLHPSPRFAFCPPAFFLVLCTVTVTRFSSVVPPQATCHCRHCEAGVHCPCASNSASALDTLGPSLAPSTYFISPSFLTTTPSSLACRACLKHHWKCVSQRSKVSHSSIMITARTHTF